MNKNMRIWPMEADGDCIWFSDRLIGGLYQYHILDKKVECEISPLKLYYRNVFRINGIVCWKEFIILCPFYLNYPVIVFSKKEKSMKSVFIRGTENNTRLDCAKRIENILYLNMFNSYIAVWLINLDELCDLKTKEIIPKMIPYPDSCLHTVWFAKYFDEGIYLPDYQRKTIYKIEKEKILKINAKIPKNIFTIYFYYSELWIIPEDGWEIYRIDQDGELLETVLFGQDDSKLERNYLYHIAITEDYFFLMSNNKMLECYERKNKNRVELMIPDEELENQYTNELPGTFLFGVENDNKLFIPPYGNRGLEINLQTLECKPFDVFFPEEVQNLIDFGIEITAAQSEANLFFEKNSKSLLALLNYCILKESLNHSDKSFKMTLGEKIYCKSN